MTVGTTEFALWLPLMSTSRWKSRIEPDDAVVHDSQVYFILEKYIVNTYISRTTRTIMGLLYLKKSNFG